MRMEVHLQQRMEQRMHLSQQMLQNLELLQLPIMELRDLIQQELEENPALEEKQDVRNRLHLPSALDLLLEAAGVLVGHQSGSNGPDL